MGAEDILVKTKLGEYLVKRGLLYTESDEWIKIQDNIVTLGITDYAQKKLKYVVNVELPEPGTSVKAGEPIVTLESVKSVADAYSPCSGEVLEINEELYDTPDLINKDPYGAGWLVKIKPAEPLDESKFLSPEVYAEKIKAKEE